MERTEIFEVVRRRLAEGLEIEEEEIQGSSNLIDDLDADSLDLLELILLIKDDFGITVSDGDVKVLLADLAQFLPAGTVGSDFNPDDLALVARSLTVSTIVDFVDDRIGRIVVTGARAADTAVQVPPSR